MPKFENERIGQALRGPALFKSRFCALGVGREHPCLSPDAGGASLGANPTERAAKSQDLNTALIFGPFHQGKRTVQHDFMPKKRLFHLKITQNHAILMRLPSLENGRTDKAR
jgi:hypothetical protein